MCVRNKIITIIRNSIIPATSNIQTAVCHSYKLLPKILKFFSFLFTTLLNCFRIGGNIFRDSVKHVFLESFRIQQCRASFQYLPFSLKPSLFSIFALLPYSSIVLKYRIYRHIKKICYFSILRPATAWAKVLLIFIQLYLQLFQEQYAPLTSSTKEKMTSDISFTSSILSSFCHGISSVQNFCYCKNPSHRLIFGV